MKKLLTIAMLLLTVVACKEENNPLNKLKEVTDKAKEVKQGLGNINEMVKEAEDLQENVEKLAELTPVSKEIIKAWMPTELDNLKRTKYGIGKQMGFAQVSNLSLEFKEDDTYKKVDVSITDGAGNGASFISVFIMVQNADIDSEDQTGYERTETFDGQKILVKYSNPEYNNRSQFNYLINNRLLVEAKGWQMEPEELWVYLKKLEIEKLIE